MAVAAHILNYIKAENINMSKTLYMHIGMPRTGTTSIQNFCFEYKNTLLRYGYLYPEPLLGHPGHPYLSENIAKIYLFSHEQHKNAVNNFYKEVESCPCSNLIFSSEIACCEDISTYAYLMNLADNAKIILYLRKTSSYFESVYAYTAKDRYKQYSPYQYNLATITINKWISDIGYENCQILDFDAACKNNGLIASFMNALGIPGCGSTQPDNHDNSSLKTEYALFAYHLQQLPLNERQWNLCWEAIENLSRQDKTAKNWLLLPPQIYQNPASDLLEEMRLQAKWLKDPDWVDKCMQPPPGRQAYPHPYLPAEKQHEIFSRLPDAIKNIICSFSPHIANKAANQEILPPIPPLGSLQAHWHTIWQETFLSECRQRQQREIEAKNALQTLQMELLRQKLAVYSVIHGKPWRDMPAICDLASQQPEIIMHVEQMRREASGLRIISNGNDPSLRLPAINFKPDCGYLLAIDAEGDDPIWEIFYMATGEDSYSETSKTVLDIRRKDDKAGTLILLPRHLGPQSLRLDCGCKPGQYLIKSLKIYELPDKELLQNGNGILRRISNPARRAKRRE